jgi:hypothetical protein
MIAGLVIIVTVLAIALVSSRIDLRNERSNRDKEDWS